MRKTGRPNAGPFMLADRVAESLVADEPHLVDAHAADHRHLIEAHIARRAAAPDH